MNKDSFADFFRPLTVWAQTQTGGGQHMRPLFMGAAVLAFAAILIGAGSALNSATKDLRRVQSEYVNLSRQLSEGSWEERRRQSDSMRVALSERFWSAETAGLAEATLERWLRERADKYGVKPDSIRIQRSNVVATGIEDSIKSSLKGVQRMTAKITFAFQPQAVMQLLDDASRYEKILTVDRLFIRSGRNAVVEIDVSTLIRLDEAPVAR